MSTRDDYEIILINGVQDLEPPALHFEKTRFTSTDTSAQCSHEQIAAGRRDQEGHQACSKHGFVVHNSMSINDSHYIWHDDETNSAEHYSASSDMDKHARLTPGDHSQLSSMSQLLDNFCQRIEFPVPLPNEVARACGVFATALCGSYRDNNFPNACLPFGLRAIKPVDPDKQLHLLCKKTKGECFPICAYGDHLILHKDEGMLERGLINYSVFGFGSTCAFAFMIIADVNSSEYISSFGAWPSDPFDIVIAVGCLTFRQALLHISHPAYKHTTAILARQIGRFIFEESTKIATPRSEAGNATNKANRARDDRPSLVPSEPNKKKAKKAKKKSSKTLERAAPVIESSSANGLQFSSTFEISVPAALEDLTEPETLPFPAELPLAFSFASSDKRLICQYGRCMIVANANCPSAVICPRCTAYSFTRYCSHSHLVADVRSHFLSGTCGCTLIPGPVDEGLSSIPLSALQRRPYIQETMEPFASDFPKYVLERHRQAVWRCMNIDDMADYWIFDDIDRIKLHDTQPTLTPLETKKKQLQRVRGTGTVCAVVKLPPTDHRKEKLNEVLDKCLRLGFAAGSVCLEDCLWLFGVIEGELTKKGEWDAAMEERIAVQMGFEFGWRFLEAKSLHTTREDITTAI